MGVCVCGIEFVQCAGMRFPVQCRCGSRGFIKILYKGNQRFTPRFTRRAVVGNRPYGLVGRICFAERVRFERICKNSAQSKPTICAVPRAVRFERICKDFAQSESTIRSRRACGVEHFVELPPQCGVFGRSQVRVCFQQFCCGALHGHQKFRIPQNIRKA